MSSFRCTGHCCKRFALKHSLSELRAEYEAWQKDPSLSKIKDIEKIATMVIPVASSADGREHVYTCKHLSPEGDCTVYETRPQMCRDFPDEKGCHFWKCTSEQSAYFGMPLWRRLVTRVRWLKQL